MNLTLEQIGGVERQRVARCPRNRDVDGRELFDGLTDSLVVDRRRVERERRRAQIEIVIIAASS